MIITQNGIEASLDDFAVDKWPSPGSIFSVVSEVGYLIPVLLLGISSM